MSNTSKIFSEQEFNKRVETFWNLMVIPEFPNKECPAIEHDRAKRRTRNLGKAHYRPIKLSFSYRMLDGRFLLEDIDDVIKHEIGHLLAYFRYGEQQGHNENFKKIAREFGFNGMTSTSMTKVEGFKEKNPKKQIPKYRVYCTHCGSEWYKYRKSGLTENPEHYICPCKTKHSLRVDKIY